MSEIGDAPTPGDVAAAVDSGGDDGGLVSFEDALAGAIADTADLPADAEDEGETTAEATDDLATDGDEEKTPVEKPPKKPEPKKDEKKDEPPADEAKVSEKNRKEFAALARERGKLRDRDASLAAREESLKAIEPKAKAFDDVRRRIHEDPFGVLMEAGGDELVNKVLDQIQSGAKSPEMREVDKLRNDLAAEKARLKAEADAQVTANWQNGIIAEVQKEGERFDLVNSLGEHDAVIAVIASYYAKHKAPLPTAIAAQVIEEGLEKRLAASKKFGKRGAVTPPQASTGTPPPKKKSNTTLSSVAAGDVPSGDDDGPLDEAARFKWAMGLAAG